MDDILTKIMDSGSPEISIPAGPQRVIIFKDDPEESGKVYCLLQLTDNNKIMVTRYHYFYRVIFYFLFFPIRNLFTFNQL